MAFRHYALTLTGVAQRLSDVLDDGVGVINPTNDVPLREIILAADPANTAVVYVGGTNATVSATSHAFSLDPTQASQAPVRLGGYDGCGPLHLADFFAVGTNNERLMIGVVPY